MTTMKTQKMPAAKLWGLGECHRLLQWFTVFCVAKNIFMHISKAWLDLKTAFRGRSASYDSLQMYTWIHDYTMFTCIHDYLINNYMWHTVVWCPTHLDYTHIHDYTMYTCDPLLYDDLHAWKRPNCPNLCRFWYIQMFNCITAKANNVQLDNC